MKTPYGSFVFNRFAVDVAKRGYFDGLALAHRAILALIRAGDMFYGFIARIWDGFS